MEWLANISIWYVVAAAIVLLILRIVLGKLKHPAAKPAAEIAESALIAIILVFMLIRPFIVQAFIIPSESMIPTLDVSDRILVNKLVYHFREPNYGDIVVFKAPPEAMTGGMSDVDYIKRLIGKEGDTIEVRGGYVYRNGNRLDEPYTEAPGRINLDSPPITVPRGSLFVMGDNRNNSNDSRFWGPLARKRLIGKAFMIFWPVKRVHFLH